ncbi:MAG: nitronate monooxygenase [Candidatus Sumerlaeia bacterium]|nr:nitronate monooxygenase [Candidatus Sumerlaeia bacterium]
MKTGAMHPPIIQGGMGVAVSGWRLANKVARRGMLGVVSGTGLDLVFLRRLQLGDTDGTIRHAMAHFPCQETAKAVLDAYFIPGGKAEGVPFKAPSMFRVDSPPERMGLAVVAAFVEVFLAREGHEGPVGINLLEKIPLPNPALLYGAMLGGVDYVLMGAGIPWQIPGLLDSLSQHKRTALRIYVEDEPSDTHEDMWLDPSAILRVDLPPLKRPNFLAIISSATLAQALLKRATGKINGFVVEGFTAGGHNAPPRGPIKRNERGEPIYGDRDITDLSKMTAHGLPFWVAGGKGTPESLADVQASGAEGIQVGTLFAFCADSGLEPELRRSVLEGILDGTADVLTDPLASPTGFPFKVARLEGSLSQNDVYLDRNRICDAGYLRRVYRKPDGSLGYRCASEPTKAYLAKGGTMEETEGRKCLCNALLANIGVPQSRKDGYVEGTLVTAGDDLPHLVKILGRDILHYTADDVLDFLLSPRLVAGGTTG